MRPTRALLAVFAVCAFVWAPAAVAKQYAPPGKAGTSEYAEDIPSSGGNVSAPVTGGGNKTAAEINSLGSGKKGVRKLAKLGTSGAAAAQFAQQTAPQAVRISTIAGKTAGTAPATTTTTGTGTTSTGTNGSRQLVTDGSTLTASGGSALGGVGRLLGGSDGGGIGLFLPLLLASALGWVAATAVHRARAKQRNSREL